MGARRSGERWRGSGGSRGKKTTKGRVPLRWKGMMDPRLTEPRREKGHYYNIKELKERGRQRETNDGRELEGKHFSNLIFTLNGF
jgi:hypothetical protein